MLTSRQTKRAASHESAPLPESNANLAASPPTSSKRSTSQRRLQQVQRDQQAWREQRSKARAKRQPRRRGEELGVNTSESSSDEGCSACAMLETGADTTHQVQPLVSDEGKGQQQVVRTAQEMFQDIDDNPNLSPECRGAGGELIQLTREQCHEMLVPYGSWYRGGIVVLPGYPKGMISKGHTIPKGHSKGVINKGKGQGGVASSVDSLHYKGGGALSTLKADHTADHTKQTTQFHTGLLYF